MKIPQIYWMIEQKSGFFEKIRMFIPSADISADENDAYSTHCHCKAYAQYFNQLKNQPTNKSFTSTGTNMGRSFWTKFLL